MELLKVSHLHTVYHGGSLYCLGEYTEPSTFCQLGRTCQKYQNIFLELESLWCQMMIVDINSDILKLLQSCVKESRIEASHLYYGFRSFMYSAQLLAQLLHPGEVTINVLNLINELKGAVGIQLCTFAVDSLNKLETVLKTPAVEGHYHLRITDNSISSFVKCSNRTKDINLLMCKQIAKINHYPPDGKWFEDIWKCIDSEQERVDSLYRPGLLNILCVLRSIGYRWKYGIQ